MSVRRHFPPPWDIDDNGACFMEAEAHRDAGDPVYDRLEAEASTRPSANSRKRLRIGTSTSYACAVGLGATHPIKQ